MANFVIKKDGTKEPFDAAKIRKAIIGAAQRADLSKERIDEVVAQVLNVVTRLAGGKEEIATAEIREIILGELDTIEPSISENWLKYDREKQGGQE